MVLALAWAGYLIPKALKHHDEVARTRSIDRFSTAMRVLARREPDTSRDSRSVVSPARSGNEACTDANMWVQAIDATSGNTLGSFTAYDGPFPARIIISTPKDGHLHYGWWYSRDESEPSEQTRADVRRTG